MYDYRKFKQALSALGADTARPACGDTGERVTTSRPVALIETDEEGLVALSAGRRTVAATFCGTSICKNCGFVSLHALGALDLGFSVLPNPDQN